MLPIRWMTCLVALLACCFTALTSQAADKPNFIVINIDDLGYGDIGPFGSDLKRTPNLDRMAKEGRKLTSYYAAPVCSPSRASLMTGCYPKRSLPIPHVLFPSSNVGLAQEEITIAELLKEQGYTTGIIGKWHLGDQPQFLPTQQGFDYYYGLPYSNDMGPAEDGVKSNFGQPLPKSKGRGQPPLPLVQNETVLQRVLAEDQQELVKNYTEEAVRFLYKHRDEPFFLYLPHSAVHWPLYPGEGFQGQSKHGLFVDWVEEVDWSVGQVLQTLRDLGLDKNTLVIFTSDNGGQNAHGAVNLPLRGGKGSTFEGGIRVPTIAWQPGTVPADSETDAITSMMDILPTFVKLAGGEVPTDRKIDGGDIWPLLAGEEGAKSPHENFYYYRGLKLKNIRSGPWKLNMENGELFNLEDDISESEDVAKENPEIVKKIKQLAAEMEKDLGTDGFGPGCRPLGKAENAEPLIGFDGTIRKGMEPTPAPYAGTGIMVGAVSSSSALAQVRLSATDHLVDGDLPGMAGVVKFILHTESDSSTNVMEQMVEAKADDDFVARVDFTGLKPGMKYICRTMLGENKESMHPGPTATFQTLPGKEKSEAVKFVVVTGMNYAKFHGDNRINRAEHLLENNRELPAGYQKPDKFLGYPSLDTIRHMEPNFFVGTGDNIYYDSPSKPRAETLTEMRKKWHEQFVQPRYHQLFAEVPTYWEIDDHDYRVDDCDNTGDYSPSPQEGLRIMLEQLPYAPQGDADPKTYRTHRVTKDLQIWLTENRRYRSPNLMKDGPGKTIWGAEQKEWLKRTLKESNATFKVLISPTPMIGPDDLRKKDNHTNIGGFQHERDEFFAFLKENGLADEGFYLVCGDRHWQYVSIAPEGIQEFSSGALVDANSRLGRKPGDPKSTDPDGKIKQTYYQTPASGGFLLVESLPASAAQKATLNFRFYNTRGKLLHEVVKQRSK